MKLNTISVRSIVVTTGHQVRCRAAQRIVPGKESLDTFERWSRQLALRARGLPHFSHLEQEMLVRTFEVTQ